MNKDLVAKLGCGIIVSEKERSLIEQLRKVPFGRVVIFMENNQPVRIEEVRESVKL